MKPVHPQSEELTKVRTIEDALDEFDRDDQTMIGNSEELAAKSMMVPDPQPTIPRASTNVIRRTGPTLSVRAPSDLPTITAEGTKDEPIDDDDAFAPWDDTAQRTAPQAPEQLVAALNDAAMTPSGPVVAPLIAAPPVLAPPMLPLPAPVLEPAQLVVPPLAPLDRPVLVQTVVAAPTEPPPIKGYRWDRIGFVMVIVAMLGICIAGYLRIASLEDELARTKAALDAKSR